MELLPRSMGTRPRVAVELRPEGVVAARAEDGGSVLTSIARGELREGQLTPGLKAGNLWDRAAVVTVVRRVLDGVIAKGGERSKYVTLIVPDAAVRVLLLDFDALPSKASEALAVVRFRLKKMLPFDAEHAVVSYQVMSTTRDLIRVLAVAMPCEVLSEYEGLITDAGYQPGAVLPSTLATVAGLESTEGATAAPVLVVNAGADSITTAIVQGGVLLLHRTVDTGSSPGDGDGSAGSAAPGSPKGTLPLVDRESSAAEWSRPAPEDYDRMDAETEMQAHAVRRELQSVLPTSADEAVRVLNQTEPVSAAREITQAVSVAAAYFEDTLGGAPPVVLAAGTMGAEQMGSILGMYGMEELRVREMVDGATVRAGETGSPVPPGWLAGVRGALRS